MITIPLVRDVHALVSRRVMFDVYKDCFNFAETRISPSDIDLVVERRGCFLIVEFKRSIDEALSSNGQRRLLFSFARLGDYLERSSGVHGVAVFIVIDPNVTEEGFTGCTPEALFRVKHYPEGWQPEHFLPTSLEQLKARFRSWFDYADRQQVPWLK